MRVVSITAKIKLDELASKFAPVVYQVYFKDAESRQGFQEMWKDKYDGEASISDCIAKDAYELAHSLLNEGENHKILR